jgi:hypothetical protein
MENIGKMLHEDHYFLIERVHAEPPRRFLPDLGRMIKHRLAIRRLCTDPPALSATVFGIGLEGQAPHQ